MLRKNNKNRTVNLIQGLTLIFIWILAGSMTLLFINLVHISYQVDDHQSASIVISIIAVIVFWILAGILTYVFVGLHRFGKKEEQI